MQPKVVAVAPAKQESSDDSSEESSSDESEKKPVPQKVAEPVKKQGINSMVTFWFQS